MTEPGTHELKNGWYLYIGKHQGTFRIYKNGIYRIEAERTTGGQWGDGTWEIEVHPDKDDFWTRDFIPVSGGFDIETYYSVIDQMEELMDKYSIKDYSISGIVGKIRYGLKRINNKVIAHIRGS